MAIRERTELLAIDINAGGVMIRSRLLIEGLKGGDSELDGPTISVPQETFAMLDAFLAEVLGVFQAESRVSNATLFEKKERGG